MIYYLQVINRDAVSNLGVSEKVFTQVRAMNEMGVLTKLLQIPRTTKLKKAMPFGTSSIEWNKIELSEVDGLYIRYALADYQFIKFLRRMREHFPNQKIVIEIPTYPYDAEFAARSMPLIPVLRDKFYRKKMYKYVDRIAVISDKDETEAFGIKAINLFNGIDFSEYSPVSQKYYDDRAVNIISVSGFREWHGLDRIIEGLRNYYESGISEIIVRVYLVGDGEVSEKLRLLISNYKLEKYVVLCGNCYGEELNEIYEHADIGVDAIAMHRKGSRRSSSLKSREYLAKGLPLIYCGEVTGLTSDLQKYTLEIPLDDSPLDVERVIEYMSNIRKHFSKEQIADNVRSIAKESVDIHKTMKCITDYYLEGEIQ